MLMIRSILRQVAGKRRPLSAKKQIEQYPHTRTLEMAWVKRKGRTGPLIPVGVMRSTNTVSSKVPRTWERSVIHNHSANDREYSIPSAGDILDFFHFSRKHQNTKFDHLAVQNRKGKVIGYFTIKALPALRKAPNPRLSKVRKTLRQLESEEEKISPEEYDKRMRQIIEQLSREGLIRTYQRPMPGYRFDQQKYAFVPNHRRIL